MNLTHTIEIDEIISTITRNFDYDFNGQTTTEINDLPDLPDDFGIGLIVGASGSGKSTLLGRPPQPSWDHDKPIASHFDDVVDAQDKLSAVGLNSIPVWLRPYRLLSNGEQHRADLARQLVENARVDEFTSVVDRTVAKSISVALRRYVTNHNIKGVILASCHYDIIEWLQPDWVFDVSTGEMSRGSVRRPDITIAIREATTAMWPHFSDHHYLSGNVNRGARSFAAEWDGAIVGFVSVLAMPSGTLKNAWREHRLVVLPEFQGLGMGVRISEAVAEILLSKGKRFFGKTSHYRLGLYREQSPKWRPTSKNRKMRPDYLSTKDIKYSVEHKAKQANRLCFSHEYIGAT